MWHCHTRVVYEWSTDFRGESNVAQNELKASNTEPNVDVASRVERLNSIIRAEGLAIKVSVFGIVLSILFGSFGGMYLVARLGAGDTPEHAQQAGYLVMAATAAAVTMFAFIPWLVRRYLASKRRPGALDRS